MLAEKITYNTFDGVEVTETFYFNLSKTEIVEMQVLHEGGYTDYLNRIIDAKDTPSLYTSFKEIVLRAYGEKSDDGKKFRKSKEISEDFASSAAFDELMMKLMGSSDYAIQFINGIMPIGDLGEDQKKDLEDRTKQLIEQKKLQG